MLKKSLCALTALSISAIASAQSTPTVYGIIDVGIARESGLAAGDQKWSVMSGMSQGSRLGFRGTEDLGGGLSAIYRLEAGILVDTGLSAQGGALFGRAAFVGLQNRFGALTIGRQYTPMDTYLAYIDPYNNNSAGKAINVFNRGYAVRMDNAVVFKSAKVAGFYAHMAYGFGEVAGDESKLRGFGGALYYDKGPFHIGLAHQSSNTQSTVVAPAIAVQGNVRNSAIGTMYDFGLAKLTLGAGVSGTTVGTNRTADARSAQVALEVSSGPHIFITSYAMRDDKLAANNDANQISLGYRYALSKRTTLYSTWARIANKNKAAYAVNSTAEAGSGDRSFNIGIRHNF